MARRHLTLSALAASCLLGSAALVWAQTAPSGSAPAGGGAGAATGAPSSGAATSGGGATPAPSTTTGAPAGASGGAAAQAPTGGATRDGAAPGGRAGMSGSRDGAGAAVRVEGGGQGRMERRATSVERRTTVRGGYDGPRRGMSRTIVRHRPGYNRRIVVRHGPVCRVRIARVRTAYGPRLRKVRVCRRW